MARPGRSRPDPGADPAYAGLKARIVARTGHHYYIDKDDLLLDRLHRRMRAVGVPDCAAYAARLADPAAGAAEWERLEAEITIGETFFFRYAEQFQALRATILPGLIAARADERALRVWSAGCSTGAEPYSLAILAHEALGAALPDWRVAILGTDISAEALAVARAAEYGRWALRTMPPEERLRYFTRLPPRPGALREGGYALRPEYRGLVRFERGNLLTLAEPAAEPALHDLILCRNVLIYFDAETVAAVVRGLARRLRPGGWLLLGHAEPNPAFSAFLDPVSLPGTVAYRRRGEGFLEVSRSAHAAVPLDPSIVAGVGAAQRDILPPPSAGEGGPAVRPGRERGATVQDQAAALTAALSHFETGLPSPDPLRGPPSPAEGGGTARESGSTDPRAAARDSKEAPALRPPPEAPSPQDPAHDPQDLTEARARVRALADAGETGAAWRAVRAALDRDPTDPRLRFYEGLLARGLGREAEAERAFRAALYLDRGFVMAHYHLGLLLLALDRPADAARALDNVVALGQALPPDAVLPEGDGASAGEVAAGAAAARAGIGPVARA
ncbi:CheR family methyltransferase [Methylobacterium sp. NEAU 140]|uniref:CheR family methyltransferase n=1 Tax=Methylobacterium sp. NEAU 140 TaxID=3064945 RepID=UPI002735273B|nr:CheR family methyltransferase [Methylobacterium sp. NEAU 140]MDP4025058.1 CheR family methyltransferase [Methylobacterium sp. NEAU 140]